MDLWLTLLDILLLVGAAFLLGVIAERLRQSAIVGYILAGFLLGPKILSTKLVFGVAEVGVVLLLFSIGLEFSLRRLKSIGPIAVGGGTLQIVITLALFACALLIASRPLTEAIALGAMAALSSTTCVLRVLLDRAELDSVRGRNALGILLLQDIAVVPLVVLIVMLGHSDSVVNLPKEIGKTLASVVALIAGFYLLFSRIVPSILQTTGLVRSRELVALLAILIGVGSAGIAHLLELSPALGAFLAGMFLAESPFATQIRADVAPLRTLFTTLFFSSIGMLANPTWIAQNIGLVIIGVLAVFFGKTIVVYLVARLFHSSHQDALATGFTLAQIGEFSFVLATVAKTNGVISERIFSLVTSVAVITLFFAPSITSLAQPLAELVVDPKIFLRRKKLKRKEIKEKPIRDRIFIVGFGPAAQRVAEILMNNNLKPTIIEQNPNTAKIAQRYELPVQVGDAKLPEVLERARIDSACVVVVTIPDPRSSRAVIEQIKSIAPDAVVVARARYSLLRWELEEAGADVIVNEEDEVGRNLALQALKVIKCDAQATVE